MADSLKVLILLLLFACCAPHARAAETAAERFGGVGLQAVPTVEGDLVVLRVVAETPAAAQGVKPGDLIYRVDDFILKGSDFGKVVTDHLWGPVGSDVVLYYRRPGVAGDRQVHLQRVEIDPQLTVTPAIR